MTVDNPMASRPRRLGLVLALGLVASVALGLRAQQVPDARKPRGLMRPPAGVGVKAPAARGPGLGGGSLPPFRAGKLLGGQGTRIPAEVNVGAGLSLSGGTLAATGTTRPVRGPRTADIRDYGAVEGRQADRVANSLAIQRAHDALCHSSVLDGGQSPEDYRGTIYIPSGYWFLQYPVWIDGDYIDVVGEGPSSILATWPLASPALIMGRKRAAAWKADAQMDGVSRMLSAGSRMDLHGVFADGTVTSGPGQRWALRSKQAGSRGPNCDNRPCFPAIPPATTNDGGAWGDTQKLSLSIAFMAGDKGQVLKDDYQGYHYLCGIGGDTRLPSARPQPWCLMMQGRFESGGNLGDGKYHFLFCTDEGNSTPSEPDIREFTFGDTTAAKGLQRIEIEVDFTQNDATGFVRLSAWINGVQQKVTRSRWCNFSADSNRHFARNEYGAFNVFAAGTFVAWDHGPYDGIFCGLRVGTEPRYLDRPGRPQARIDGRPINDRERFFRTDGPDWGSTLCVIPLTDPPDDPSRTSNRYITTLIGGYGLTAYGFMANHVKHTIFDLVSRNQIRNVRLESHRDVPAGAALLCGNAFHQRYVDAGFSGGWVGIDILAGYDFSINDCEWTGRGHGLRATTALLHVRGNGGMRPSVAGSLITLIGCGLKAENLVCAQIHPSCRYLINLIGDGGYGYNYDIRGLVYDQEWAPAPSRALIRCQIHVDTPQTTLHLEDISSANPPPGVPVVELVGRVGGGRGKFTARNILGWGSTSMIRVGGGQWAGRVDDSESLTPTQWVENTGPAGSARIVTHHVMDALPTDGTWTAGCHEIEIRNPAAGKPRKYLCVGSGEGRNARWAPVETLGTPVQAP